MNWFFAAGDAPFFYLEQLQKLSFFPDMWMGELEFGVSSLPALWINYPFRFVTFLLFKSGMSWFFIDKFWWLLIAVFSVYGMFGLSRKVGITRKFSIVSSLIYTTNTYALLLFDGGQLGVALAYSFIPLVFSSFIDLFLSKPRKSVLFHAFIFGTLLSLLVFFDLRIAYVFTFFCLVISFVFIIKKKFFLAPTIVVIPFVIFLLNAFWLIPSVMYKESLHSVVENTIATQENLSFFSVADFTHALSLLHPNYPENLFGRVYFFKPEFLFIPILAFMLFWEADIPLLFVSLGIVTFIGSFLSKGVQDPFGKIYYFLFSNVPGFFLFRDPTKWYVIAALSYALLIPKSIEQLSRMRNKLVGIVFVVYWLFTLRYIALGMVNGNISPPTISSDYIHLKNVLVNDKTFGRTLWLPAIERFTYTSNMHPAVSSLTVLHESSTSGIIRLIKEPSVPQHLYEAGIKYLVVPEDIEHKIFLSDYRYDDGLRKQIIETLDTVPWLQKQNDFNGLAVYTTASVSGLFTLTDHTIDVKEISPDIWSFVYTGNKNTELNVSYNYDPSWVLKIGNNFIRPNKTKNGLMSFMIPAIRDSEVQLIYKPTKIAEISSVISLISLFAIGGVIVYLWRGEK